MSQQTCEFAIHQIKTYQCFHHENNTTKSTGWFLTWCKY